MWKWMQDTKKKKYEKKNVGGEIHCVKRNQKQIK